MRISYLLIILLIGWSLNACKSGKESASVKEMKETPKNDPPKSPENTPPDRENFQSESWTREQASLGPDSFRLIVTFISIGGGTDPQAKIVLDSYLLDYKRKTGKNTKYVMIPWGREGEVDCCFDLKELNDSEQVSFIDGMRNAMKSRELIQINERARNRFKSK